jgi:hypothetical protein
MNASNTTKITKAIEIASNHGVCEDECAAAHLLDSQWSEIERENHGLSHRRHDEGLTQWRQRKGEKFAEAPCFISVMTEISGR